MQERDQGGLFAANWSWHDARRVYYEALTEPDSRRREALWADLFRGLGQIMHLVVDASVPEHTRNDPHPIGGVSQRGSYEYWISGEHATPPREEQFVAKYLSAPIGFIEEILDVAPPAGEPVATVPIARLIDADRYDGSNPHVTVGVDPRAPAAAGLAEIANANFFSENTLRGEYPYPNEQGLVPARSTTPLGRVRRYFSRPAEQGLLPASPLRAECAAEAYYWRGELIQPPPYPCVDAAVWEETARHMLPRAVGYARGVLEYFFRGSLRVNTSRMRLGSPFLQIDNLTGEEMSGVFEVFGRPDVLTGEGRERTGVINGGAAATIAPHRSVVLPITYLQPEHLTPWQILVFRGRIGLEEDAVAAQVFAVPHVIILQTTHTADLRETCGTTFEYPYWSREEWCDWRPTTEMVTLGELITNRSANVMARVFVTPYRQGDEFQLDGVSMPGGVWQRKADEPDPRAFRMRPGAAQTLTVQLIDGTVVTSRVYGSISAYATASKSYTFSRAGDDPPWHVSARRFTQVHMSSHPSYRVVSISGHPNPTDVRTDRYSVPFLVDILRVEGNLPNPRYTQYWTDYANVYWMAPPGGPVLLQEPLRTEFAALTFGPVPRVPLEAVLERNYRFGELDFIRTFVTRESLPSTLTVIGRRPVGS
ncbi:MAG: hypothetical protein HYY76_01690 [Acidobacteria bacterium]|nr:hypothetical protein [Acidobacteriota bacterium]